MASISAKAGFTVIRSTDQTLTYTFAKVTVNVGRPNYTVRFFSGTNGNGLELGSASSDANGNASFYLIEGDYGYQVEKYGSISAKARLAPSSAAQTRHLPTPSPK